MKDYSKVLIDKKAIEASLKDVGFKNYLYKGKPLSLDHNTDALIYLLESQKMIYPEFNPNRVVINKLTLWQEIKRRIANAWYMLKGGDFE